jgi:hypothetical protein
MDQIVPSQGFRWHDLDQTLVAPKLSKLSEEMQKAFFKDEAEISFEARRRGNSAYFLPTFLDKQVERTDEWARREYEIYCECWYEQGHCISPEFVREVSTHGILGIFEVRKGTIAYHFTRQAQRTRKQLNQHCLANFARRIKVLANTWRKDLEAQATALEHDSDEIRLLAVTPTSLYEARQMIHKCDARLTEISVKIDAQKQSLTLATSTGAPVSKFLQEIRKLSELRTSFETLSKELKAREIEMGASGRTKKQANAPNTLGEALAIEQHIPATKRPDGTVKRQGKQRIKSRAERVREQRLFVAIEKGNRGLEYCLDVKAQGVTTRVTWRSDGCPKEYPDAYSHRNPRWRALIQKEKSRHTRKMKKRYDCRRKQETWRSGFRSYPRETRMGNPGRKWSFDCERRSDQELCGNASFNSADGGPSSRISR